MSIDSRTALLPPSISTESTDQGEGSTGGMRMCRSISDVDDMDKEEIAKVLAKKQKEWGSLSLFFGCRRSDLDHIYKEDIKKAQVMGALNEVYVGLSREPGIPRVCVCVCVCVRACVCVCVWVCMTKSSSVPSSRHTCNISSNKMLTRLSASSSKNVGTSMSAVISLWLLMSAVRCRVSSRRTRLCLGNKLGS